MQITLKTTIRKDTAAIFSSHRRQKVSSCQNICCSQFLLLESSSKFEDNDIDNEPPLLEELGVNFEHIRLKTFAVLNPMAYASSDVAADQDLAGPLVFCLLFGASLLLNGRVSVIATLKRVLACFLRFISAISMELECSVSIFDFLFLRRLKKQF